MKGRKGQAAFEYLTTYGWVFLVIMIGLGALAYFGYWDLTGIMPERCWFGSQLVCEDYSVQNIGSSQTQIQFRLKNNFQEGIQIENVSHVEAGKTLSGCTLPMIGIKKVAEVTCILTPQLSAGGKSSVPIEIVFRDNESSTKPNHTIRGELLINVPR